MMSSKAASATMPQDVPSSHEYSNNENVPLINIGERPPLATTESVNLDEDDNRETVTKPYPGVDDGFFNENGAHPDIEPSSNNIPDIASRAGTDGDEIDAGTGTSINTNVPRPLNPVKPYFPYAPGFGRDLEVGSMPDLDSIPDVNVYQHKKTLAQGMMDLALFSANANQLRYVLETFNRHPYFYPSVILISISLILQVAIGVGLIWNATYNVKDQKEICIANKINNFTIIGIFIVTTVNVFISAFGVASPEL